MLLLRQLAASLVRPQQAQNGLAALALQQAESMAQAAASASETNTLPGPASTSYLPADDAVGQQQQWQHQQPYMQSMPQWGPEQHSRLLARAYSAAARDPTAHGSTKGKVTLAEPGQFPRRPDKPGSYGRSKFKLATKTAPAVSKHAAKVAWLKQQPPPQPQLQAWRRKELPPGASYVEHVAAEAAAQKAKLSGTFGTMPTRLLLQLLQQAANEQRQPTSQELYTEAQEAFPGAFKTRLHFKRVLQVLQENHWAGFHRPKDAKANKKIPFTIYITKLGREQPLHSQPSKLVRAALPALDNLAQSVAAKLERKRLFADE